MKLLQWQYMQVHENIDTAHTLKKARLQCTIYVLQYFTNIQFCPKNFHMQLHLMCVKALTGQEHKLKTKAKGPHDKGRGVNDTETGYYYTSLNVKFKDLERNIITATDFITAYTYFDIVSGSSEQLFGKPWRTVEGTAVACRSTSLAIKKWVISKEIPMPAAISSFTKVVIAKK